MQFPTRQFLLFHDKDTKRSSFPFYPCWLKRLQVDNNWEQHSLMWISPRRKRSEIFEACFLLPMREKNSTWQRFITKTHWCARNCPKKCSCLCFEMKQRHGLVFSEILLRSKLKLRKRKKTNQFQVWKQSPAESGTFQKISTQWKADKINRLD